MIFSATELADFDRIQEASKGDMESGKAPPISAILMSLQFAIVMPNKKGQMWFEDEMARLLVLASIKKVMDDYPPDMFSVGEKAFLFSVLQMGHVLRAIDDAGMQVKGFSKAFGMKPSAESDFESDDE